MLKQGYTLYSVFKLYLHTHDLSPVLATSLIIFKPLFTWGILPIPAKSYWTASSYNFMASAGDLG
jgi:hypothetical protein